MRWVWNVVRVAGRRVHTNLVGNPEVKHDYKDLAVDGKIIFNRC
jgi:hypothetical protein